MGRSRHSSQNSQTPCACRAATKGIQLLHYKDHPLADIFPLLPPNELAKLAGSIKENGFHGTITLLEEKILDGRNRYRAAKIAGIEPKFREHKNGDPLAFVLMANLHRRHLSESQRAMVAAKLANMESGANKASTNVVTSANLPTSQADAAEALHVSTRSVGAARKILAEAPKREVQAIERGEKTVNGVAREMKQASARPSPSKNGNEPPVIRDETGYPVPPPAMACWNRKAEVEETLRLISKARCAVRDIPHEDPMHVETHAQDVLASLSDAYRTFAQSVPHAVCPTCQGRRPENCMVCKGRGMISKFLWDTAIPKELKDIREHSCKH